MFNYSRTALQQVVYPEPSDPLGRDPYIDNLSAGYGNLVNNLKLHTVHVVSVVEAGRLDLLSIRYYRTVDLWWVIAAYNGIVDPYTELPVNLKVNIPTLESVNEYFRETQKQAVSVTNGVAL